MIVQVVPQFPEKIDVSLRLLFVRGVLIVNIETIKAVVLKKLDGSLDEGTALLA